MLILGFILGSIPVLYSGLGFNFSSIISVILFMIGFYISINLEKVWNLYSINTETLLNNNPSIRLLLKAS